MKLYAIVTSERASKGQGGRTIRIDIKAEDKRIIAVLTVETALNDQAVIQYRDENQIGEYFTKYYSLVKGKKEKGE